MKKVTMLAIADARKFAFSAASLLQEEPRTSDDWSLIVSDLERALELAQSVANTLAMAEDGVRE